jgi:endonuclease/exonuclease/phosphatase family metal-dependent hydrolase
MHGKMLAATVQIKGSLPIRLYNVHLGWPMPIATKRAQLAQLAQIVRTEAAEFPNQVVTGDFNSSGWAFAIDQTSDLAGLERRSYFLTTFPSPHSRIKGMLLPAFLSLDHMLFSPTLKTDPVVRASATFGDHYPIITNLFLPPQ